MNKQQLASTIWESANQMRSKIEASEYKDFILGFIFYKYLSEKEEQFFKNDGLSEDDIKQKNEEDEQYVEYVKNNLGYFISYDNLFSTWISNKGNFDISNVRDALSAFERNIAPLYKEVFENIFKTLSSGLSKLGENAQKQTKAARGLLNLIKRIPMDKNQDYDVLGFIYEYLISMFAANAGKKAGEFYTPHEVSVLMSEIISEHLKDKDKVQIFDPTSGSGSLLINIGKSLSRHLDSENKIEYYAQELKENTYNLTRMNLVMRDIKPANIHVRNADTLEDDWPFFEEEKKESTYKLVKVDAVVSNPPYSQKWSPANKENDPRYKEYGLAPRGKADYAFLLHDLYHLKDNGIMTIVLPHGVLFRGSSEGEIRKNLIEKDKIDAIIGLPANIFFGTGIPTIILILKKHRSNNDVLIIDASKGFEKSGKSNKLRDCDIRKIVDTVTSRKDVDKFSRVVSKEEIRKNEYNLNIPRYVDSSDPEEEYDLYATMLGGIPGSELMELSDYWDTFKGLKEDIFKTEDNEYYQVDLDSLDEKLKNHPSSKAFMENYKDAFNGFKKELREDLIENILDVNINKEKEKITNEIFKRLSNINLVDKYKAYQIFSEVWNVIEIDLEMILTEGFGSINKVDPNMVIKNKRLDDEDVPEVQEGWKGRILPFELVQNIMLTDEQKEIQNIENRLAEITSEYQEIIDSLDEDDMENDFLSEDKTSFVNSEVKKFMEEAYSDINTNEINILNKYLTLSRKAEKIEFIKDNPEVNWDLLEIGKDGTYKKTEINKRIRDIQETFKFEEDSLESKIQKVQFLIDEEPSLKSELKKAKEDLHIKTKETIEKLSEDESLSLLYEKWIKPLLLGLDGLGENVTVTLADKIKAINKKYANTFEEIDNELNKTQEALIDMCNQLVGSPRDMEGLEELKKILGA